MRRQRPRRTFATLIERGVVDIENGVLRIRDRQALETEASSPGV